MLVIFDLDDPLFVRVLLPNFWDVDPDQLGSALAALDLANKKAKGAKVYLNLARSDSSAVMEFLYHGTGLKDECLSAVCKWWPTRPKSMWRRPRNNRIAKHEHPAC